MERSDRSIRPFYGAKARHFSSRHHAGITARSSGKARPARRCSKTDSSRSKMTPGAAPGDRMAHRWHALADVIELSLK
jgi:hypothetical protein